MKDINKNHNIRIEETKNFINFPAENPYPILRAALDGTILYANPASTLLIHNWNCDVGQSLPNPLYQSVIDILGTESTKKDVEITCKDQVFSFTIVRVPNNDFVNLYGVNITKHKQMKEELMVLNKSLEQRIIERTATLKKTNEELQIKIIEYKKAEEEITLLQTITAAIAETDNFYFALNTVLRKICEFTGWVYGEAWIPSSDGKYLTCNTVWHCNSKELERFKEKSQMFTFPPGVGLPGRVWSSKKPEWKKDITVGVDFPRAKFARKSGLKAAMGIPVMDNDKVVAVLNFFMSESHNKDSHLIKLVLSIAAQLGTIIQRRQAKEALRDSEEKLQSILDNTTAVIYVKDLHGKYTFVNKQFEKLFHLKKDEVKGKTDYDIWSKEIADTFRLNDQKVIETKTPLEFEEIAQLEDGPHTYISIKFPLYNTNGVIYAICGISTDITERKKSEEALRVSESKYQLLLENLPLVIFYKDKNSVYVSCNKNLARDLHIKPEEISGKTDYDFFPKEIAEKYRTDDKRIIESGQTIDVEEEYIKDGQELVVHTIKVPIKDENGNIIGILGSSLDITEKVNLERQAEQSKHLILMGELAAGVAHEINNPINGVINYAQILSNKSAEGSREKDIANRIIKEGNRVANIVYCLLSLAKPKKGVKNSIGIHEVLSETLILTKTQLRKEGIKLKLDIPPPQIPCQK